MIRLSVSPTNPERDAIRAAVEVLRDGGIVAYPTDTVYGLAVDPRRADAVDRLFEAKGRGASMAIPLIASSVDQAQSAGNLGPIELRLAAAFWPGPLSIVVPAHGVITPGLLGGGTTVAVRVPAHAIARALASAHGFCIAATSANTSGRPPALSADDVAASLGSRVVLLLDGGAAPGGAPSTIVEVAEDGLVQRRAGAIAWDRVIKSLQ
jgi:L-threonylcarbamoyladenylate synthase